MSTKTQHQQQFSVTFPDVTFGFYSKLNARVGKFVATDGFRPALQNVQFSSHEGWLRVHATDSYKAVRIDTMQPYDGDPITMPWVWFAKTVLPKVRFRAMELVLTITPDHVAVTNEADSWMTKHDQFDAAFPDIDRIINDNVKSAPEVGVAPAAFSPEKLADAAASCVMFGTNPVIIRQMHPLKPTLIEITGQREDLPGYVVLMPVRHDAVEA